MFEIFFYANGYDGRANSVRVEADTFEIEYDPNFGINFLLLIKDGDTVAIFRNYAYILRVPQEVA